MNVNPKRTEHASINLGSVQKIYTLELRLKHRNTSVLIMCPRCTLCRGCVIGWHCLRGVPLNAKSCYLHSSLISSIVRLSVRM